MTNREKAIDLLTHYLQAAGVETTVAVHDEIAELVENIIEAAVSQARWEANSHYSKLDARFVQIEQRIKSLEAGRG